MRAAVTFPRRARTMLAAFAVAWDRLWFAKQTTLPLELARIGIGAALLLNYGSASPHILEFWGEAGWMPQVVAAHYADDPWMQSIFFYFTLPWQFVAFHAVFLASCAAFMVGWRTSWFKWIVFIGEVSYDRRNLVLAYGVDEILCSLLFILCLAPTGRVLSLDHWREIRVARRSDRAPPPSARAIPSPSPPEVRPGPRWHTDSPIVARGRSWGPYPARAMLRSSRPVPS